MNVIEKQLVQSFKFVSLHAYKRTDRKRQTLYATWIYFR